METSQFLQTHPVFTLAEANRVLRPAGGRKATLERLKYHQGRGRIKLVAREIYATTPPDLSLEQFQPDAFLVAAALRPDAIFSHHSALDLLGAAHSEWSLVTVLTRRRRPPLDLGGQQVRFLAPPPGLRRARRQGLGTREVGRGNRILRTTGPERTLLDGFRQPHLAGGVEELVESAAGFPVLDLELLHELLGLYGTKGLWAAAGWFLERYRRTFYVPDPFLADLQERIPRSPQYLVRAARGGTLVPRWNLIVPDSLARGAEPDEA
jgi:predicted transcriptional regulator of viral defense system